MIERPHYLNIWNELSRTKSMVFLAGPRQTGKTTLATSILSSFPNHLLFNWDAAPDKSLLIKSPDFFTKGPWVDNSTPLIVFDEIHKYSRWKNYLKGIYDVYAQRFKFLVLGSGRLDVYQKGGDSLAGRYFLFYLWPLTIAELGQRRLPFRDFMADPMTFPESEQGLFNIWEQLLSLSGFPEPFVSGSQQTYVRWWATYRRQLLREDVRDMTAIKNIDQLEILFSLLPSKVGAPLSSESLARDIQISPATVKSWIDALESFFLVFRLKPWTRKITRSLLKERKLYLHNYAEINSKTARFENMVASELWRAISSWNALGFGEFSLHYLRNKEKEEVDFLIVNKGNPVLLVEAKTGDQEPAKSLRKFQTYLRIPAVQLTDEPGIKKFFINDDQKILLISAPHWLSGLP